jgi:NADPH2 dehydrogenase
MQTKTIDQPLEIRGMKIQNRISFAPMGCLMRTGEDGVVRDTNVESLRAVARGGAALLVQGATSVCRVNRCSLMRAGIWCDEQISGLRRITEAVHAEGKKIIVQIQHAGIRSYVEHPQCPSDFVLRLSNGVKLGRAMTMEEIQTAEREFIEAARRAVAAGYDGVELQGAHGWLISNFLNRRINVRDDEYGHDPMLFVRKIYEGIRETVPDNFVVGFRMNGFEPDLETGLEYAKQLDALGFDFLAVSNNGFWPEQEISKPEGYPFSFNVYAAGEIKKLVKAPVFATQGIRTAEEANAVLAATDVDMVQIGRGMLIDPEWANKVLSGRTPGKCLWCRSCSWRVDSTGSSCPGLLLLKKREGRQCSN